MRVFLKGTPVKVPPCPDQAMRLGIGLTGGILLSKASYEGAVMHYFNTRHTVSGFSLSGPDFLARNVRGDARKPGELNVSHPNMRLPHGIRRCIQ